MLSRDVRLPSIDGLREFEAAARLGSFERATEELNITASAISKRISTVEDLLAQRCQRLRITTPPTRWWRCPSASPPRRRRNTTCCRTRRAARRRGSVSGSARSAPKRRVIHRR